MPRIQPVEKENAPEESRPLMEQGEQAAGQMLNFFKQMAVSPASFKGYMEIDGALQGGALDPKTRELYILRPRTTTAALTDSRYTPRSRSRWV